MFIVSFMGIADIVVSVMAKCHIRYTATSESVHIVNILSYGITVLYTLND